MIGNGSDTRVATPGKLAKQKWGDSSENGFQIIPNVLFRCQRLLNLDALDVVILLNITMHWWEAENLPHPKPSVIARRMNVTTRTVERRIKRLQKEGFLTRLPSQTRGGRAIRPFVLEGLVRKLSEMAEGNLRLRRVHASPISTDPLVDSSFPGETLP